MTPEVSIIVPAYNEYTSLSLLVKKLMEVMEREKIDGEILLVDDGSTDGTTELITYLSVKYMGIVRSFYHTSNRGKSAAVQTSFDNSFGNVIVLIDADMQYDPNEIPKLLNLIQQGYDVANGIRDYRKYPFGKKLASKLYNLLARYTFGYNGHDLNCGFKALKREVLLKIPLRKGYHRYLIAVAQSIGFKIGEVQVNLYPRKYGKNKYGLKRFVYGLTDMIALKLRLSVLERPMVVFGLSGLTSLILGIAIFAYLICLSLFLGEDFHFRPLTLAAIFFLIAGVQFFALGLLAESVLVLREDLYKLHSHPEAIDQSIDRNIIQQKKKTTRSNN